MPEAHPDRVTLELLLAGKLARKDAAPVVRHLLRRCEPCGHYTAALWQAGQEAMHTTRQADKKWSELQLGAYSAAFDAVFQRTDDLARQLDDERRVAGELAQQLASHPLPRQITLVTNSARFHSWALCELLIERSFDSRFDDPQLTLDLARLADLIAAHLDPGTYGSASLADVRARARSHVANGLRILGDLKAADDALREAILLLREGTGDALHRAEILAFRGELRRAQRHFPEALRLFDRAVRVYLRMGFREQAATWLISKGATHGYRGNPQAAIETLNQALALLDTEADPRLFVAVRHGLVHFLLESDRLGEAQRQFEQLQILYRRTRDRMNLVRLRWLEGQLMAASGKPAEAEQAFLEVREQFLSRGIAYDAALVSLNLAELYASARRTDALKQLASEILPIFRSLGVHREAIAALLVLQQAAEMEAVSIGLIKEVAAYFEKARKNPALPFRPTA